MADITLHTTVSRSADIITSDMSGESVMLSIERGMYYGMQEVATFIWEQLETRRTVSEVASLVHAHFAGCKLEQCEQDVLAFVQDLHQEELIHVDSSAAA